MIGTLPPNLTLIRLTVSNFFFLQTLDRRTDALAMTVRHDWAKQRHKTQVRNHSAIIQIEIVLASVLIVVNT